MLAWTIYSSFVGAALMLLLPRENLRLIRTVALLTAAAGFFIALTSVLDAKPGELKEVTRHAWLPGLGIDYYLAADGISLVLVLLTGLASVAGVLFSWNVTQYPRQFFALYFTLIGGVYGVFLSFDLFLLFVFYELAIIPKYFLIAIWGSTRREYGAMKLALYSFAGSAMVLLGLVAAYALAGGKTMELAVLAKYPFSESFQMWAFPLVFIGFAILAGLWPWHTWAPTGHVAAPTAASMLLAGVVMKLGAYGCLRVAMTLFPLGLHPWAIESYRPNFLHAVATHSLTQNAQWFLHLFGFTSWPDLFGVLAIIGIVYGGMVALVQKDFKFVIGYSSVSHMGFVLLGLVTLSEIGLSGAVLQMFSHGIIAGLLFAAVGRMVYDRAHTRDLDALEGFDLRRALPFAAITFLLAAMASMGLPGFSGFVAELQVVIGAWETSPTLAVFAGLGILIGVAYTLRALTKAFFNDAPESGALAEAATAGNGKMEPVSVPERFGALILLAASLAVGLFPAGLLDLIVPSFGSPLFDWLRKGL